MLSPPSKGIQHNTKTMKVKGKKPAGLEEEQEEDKEEPQSDASAIAPQEDDSMEEVVDFRA